MVRSFARLTALAVACHAAVPAAVAGQTPDLPVTVILVRHAEKAAEPATDPPLTEAGRVRARALADALAHAGVAAIYSTNFERTTETARPTAERTGVSVTTVDAGRDIEAEASALAERILERHAGEVVLVVGHSNTVPALVAALTGRPVPGIADHEYEDLFLVLASGPRAGRFVRSRYGPPNPAAQTQGKMPRSR